MRSFSLYDLRKEVMLADKACNIALAEAAYMEAMLDAKLKLNLLKSEYKVLTESEERYQVSDLVYYFNEAAKEKENAEGGVFTKIWNGLKAFFINTFNAIQKVFTNKDTEAYKKLHESKKKIKFPWNPEPVVDEADRIVTEIDNNPLSKFGKVGLIAAAIGAAGGTVAIGKKLFSKANDAQENKKPTDSTVGEAVGLLGKLQKLFEKIKSIFSKDPKELQEGNGDNKENTDDKKTEDNGDNKDGENKDENKDEKKENNDENKTVDGDLKDANGDPVKKENLFVEIGKWLKKICKDCIDMICKVLGIKVKTGDKDDDKDDDEKTEGNDDDKDNDNDNDKDNNENKDENNNTDNNDDNKKEEGNDDNKEGNDDNNDNK